MSELPEGFGADKISLALKQQANEREQIALLTKENTELKAQIERDKEPVKALYDEANELRTELERVKADRNRQGILAITEAFKMCDELRAKLEYAGRHVRCMYCDEKYTFEDKDKLADHILGCEKSPLVQLNKEIQSKAIDLMDLTRDEFIRICAITDNQEIIGICQRSQEMIDQKYPVIKQRDDLQEKLNLSESQVLEQIEHLREISNENDALTTRAERAEAARAEMRSMIPELWRCANDDCDLSQANINDALSTQCGVGWLSPEKAGRLREALKEIQGHPDAAHTTIIEIATNALAETGGEK